MRFGQTRTHAIWAYALQRCNLKQKTATEAGFGAAIVLQCMKSRLGCGSKQLRSSKSQMKRRAEHIAQPVSEFAGLFMVRLSFVCASNNSESAKCYVVMVPVSDEVLSWVPSGS